MQGHCWRTYWRRQTPELVFTSLSNRLLDNITRLLDVLSTDGRLQYVPTPRNLPTILVAHVPFPYSTSRALPSNPTLSVSFPSVSLIDYITFSLLYLPPPIRSLTHSMLMHASNSISCTSYIVDRVPISLNPDVSFTLLLFPSSTHQLEAYSSLRLACRYPS